MKAIQIIEKNFRPVKESFLKISGTLFTLLSIFLSLSSWEDFGVTTKDRKIISLLIILVLSLIFSVMWICLFKKAKIIWSKGTNQITACYGDIIKIAFSSKNKNKKIVVIPVNTCFDTIVDKNLAEHEYPLVASTTIHGMWIENMVRNGINVSDIDSLIEKSIQTLRLVPRKELSKTEKPRGKLKSYEKGSVVVLEGNHNVTYFLLALSEFNHKNKAQISKKVIIKCVKDLLNFYNKKGQGYDLYLPLFGTGRSRAYLSHKKSFLIITSTLLLYSKKVQGKVNVIVYDKDRDKISIFN